jgi:hypothetical protein
MLKLKEGFLVCDIAGEHVVLPSGDELDLNMMIRLNDTGLFLWKCIMEGTTREELMARFLEAYEVDRDTAERAVSGFVERLRENGFLV